MEENIDIIDIEDDDIIFENDEYIDEDNNLSKQIKQDKLDRKKIIEAAFQTFDEHSLNMLKFKKKVEEVNLIENKNKILLNEYNKLKQAYLLKNDEKNKIGEDLTKLKKETQELERKVSMLKSLLEIIIKTYGYEEICEVTRLTENQLKRFLN